MKRARCEGPQPRLEHLVYVHPGANSELALQVAATVFSDQGSLRKNEWKITDCVDDPGARPGAADTRTVSLWTLLSSGESYYREVEKSGYLIRTYHH